MYLLTNSVKFSFFLLLFVKNLQVLDQSYPSEVIKLSSGSVIGILWDIYLNLNPDTKGKEKMLLFTSPPTPCSPLLTQGWTQ